MNKIIRLKNTLFIPTCTIVIIYCLFNEELTSLSFVNWIRCLILLPISFLALGTLFELGKKKVKKKILKTKGLIDFLYVYSENIVNYTFYIYFFIYLVFMLDRKSILFNYLLLLIYGMFLGYRLAVRAYYYLKQKHIN